jgi:hypothetical protein
MKQKSFESRYAAGRGSRMLEKIGPRGRVFWLGPVCVWAALACTATQGAPTWGVSDAAYTRKDAALFDDRFRPELFGVEHTVEPPERDRRLAERTIYADTVARAKVVTVTRGGAMNGSSYTIVVRPEGKPLSGKQLPGSVTLIVPQSSPTFAWLEAAGQGWVGTRLVFFARAFADGLHYHATTDAEPVRKAIERAAVMDEFDR